MMRVIDLLVRPLLVFVGLAVIGLLAVRFLSLPDIELPRIAHAGGGVEGATYTNSIAALNANQAKGFRVFEVDFLTTADGETVCGHDWKPFGGEPLALGEFLQRRGEQDHPPCTLEELAEWFGANPESMLVSDAKADDADVVSELAARLSSQLIVQAYDFRQVCDLRRAGVERIILTLYRLPRGYLSLVSGLRSTCVAAGYAEAVTMDRDRVWRGHALVTKLLTGLPIYAHTVNDCSEARWLYVFGADEFYTDFLPVRSCRLFSS